MTHVSRGAGIARLLWCLAGGLGAMVWPARAEDALYLNVGAQRIVDLGGPVTRIVLGQSGIVDASVQNDHLVQVLALKPGHTTMAVFTSDPAQAASYTINVGGGRAGATGAGKAAPGASLAKTLAAEPDLAGIRVQPDGQHVMLSGNVESLDAHTKAMTLATAAAGANVVDNTQVTGDQMVAVEIRFAAVDANTVNALGFNFASLGGGFQGAYTTPSSVSTYALNGSGSTTAGVSGAQGLSLVSGLPIASAFNLFLASTKSNILGVVSALNSAGLTQLLAQPTLVVRSGENASFLAGGEVPIPVPQSGGGTAAIVTIEYHPYGVKLDVAPTVLSGRRISLRVSPEVSDIDPNNGVQLDGFNVPAFRKRTTSTTIELGDGESFVLAGLIYSTNTLSESRIPLLGNLPIIGSFFKLSSNARDRQELIVIATPHLVRPLDSHSLPPLPGVEATTAYNPSVGDMVLNTHSLGQALATYGLMK